MSAHIEITGQGPRLNGKLRYLVDSLQAVRDNAENTKAMADQAALGGDYTSLGALWGVDAATAQDLYTLLGSVVTELQGTFITQFLGRLG